MTEVSQEIQKKAPLILAKIKAANSILLHFHPSPDPDSVGSALAMKFALEQMGKKVTVIKGDSDFPEAFRHFAGADSVLMKNFFEVNINDFDLFIILDSGGFERVSRLKPMPTPIPIATVVIDHHRSNPGGADIDLIEPAYPATAQILFDLFSLWGLNLTRDIAENLFMGIFTDTGGFKFPDTSVHTFEIAAKLRAKSDRLSLIISKMENSNVPEDLAFEALALSSIQTYLNDGLALSVLSFEDMKKNNILIQNVRGDMISPILRTVKRWQITGAVFETQPNVIKISFRSKNGDEVDVSKLAVALGGGGHKAAAGAVLNMPIKDAVRLVVTKAQELYNLKS